MTLSPFWLVIILLLPATNTALPSNLTINLFVSEALGEVTLIELLRDTKSLHNFNIIVRGMGAKDTNLAHSISRWQYRIKQAGVGKNIQINPVLFREQNINHVPAMIVVNGNTKLTAFGVTSPEWMMRQYRAGKHGNIGAYGSTLPVSEPDLLEHLLLRLKQQNWQPLQEKAQKRLQTKTLSFGAKLPTSREASSKVLKIPGHWRTPMVAVNINDRQQLKAVIPWLQQYPDALILVSSGSLQQFQKLSSLWHEHTIYIMPTELIHRFQLTTLPALMTPENLSHWRVITAAVSQFSAIDVVLWARALISMSAQSASAQETTDNPSKALCQNVPILSEKLINSVPWKELFPIRIGLAKLGSGKEPDDRANTSTGSCFCEDSAGMFHPGVTTGFWRPQRLIELTRSPGCLMALGGHKLSMVDQRRWGTLGSANIPKGLTYLHAHVYSLPLIEMLNMYTGIGGCTSDLVDFDLLNLSEVDPSWNHPELAALLSPELAAYANPAAINACTADGLAALNSQPMDNLHWCAGSWGSLYPLSGFTSTYGHFADNTSLLATRALAKIHRIGLGRKTIGEEAQCQSRITPWLPKSQYKMSMFWPEPEKQKAHWIGASAATWGMHRHPLAKDDAMYLLWQYRDCCQTVSQ
ncbi:TrbC family F-type conjugative pilus assembly protein [Endozoicomonas sp. ISHI1]|uniref:TrbC family F-type conjugative pilus assembly protein n=1 Tax=Endozoicomonas sp. ISHI1 TaxID=2825882 RepID=UPI002147C2BB|nr:TrbC family F-type conjugative pilus assembly protein [Endozoicomonas sp. ISHI1]